MRSEADAIRQHAGRMKVVSFDIFDTLITRRDVVIPADVFTLLASRIPIHLRAGDFPRERQLAENQARRIASLAGHDEVTLREIYAAYLERFVSSENELDLLTELEHQIEEEQLVLAEGASDMVAAARDTDCRVVAISDSFFSAEFLSKVLLGLGLKIDSVFSSADFRVTKAEGKLFAEVCQRLEVKPGEILHVGDNRLSDGSRALQYGVSPHVIDSRRLSFRRRSRLPNAPSGSVALAKLVTAGADWSQPETAGGEEALLAEVGSNNLAPLYFGYASWLIELCLERGRHRIAFAARDGWIVKKVFDLVAAARGLEIESTYVEVSRAALYPALWKTDPEKAASYYGLVWRRLPVWEALGRVGFSWEDCVPTMHRHGFRAPDQPVYETSDSLRDALLELSDEIAEINEPRRLNIVNYLRTTGFLEEDPPAFVDIGWRGSLQAAINSIRAGNGRADGILGLYLGTSLIEIEGLDIESFLMRSGEPASRFRLVIASPSLIELMHGAPHGSVTGYLPGGEATYEDRPAEIAQYERRVKPAQDSAVSTISKLVDGCTEEELVGAPNPDVVAGAGLSFAFDPSPSEAQLFSKLKIAADFGDWPTSLNGVTEFGLGALKGLQFPNGNYALWPPGLNKIRAMETEAVWERRSKKASPRASSHRRAERRLILHVGTHKTASTYIQRHALDAAEFLEQQLGVYVPFTGSGDRQWPHQNLAWELFGDDRFYLPGGTWTELEAELSACRSPDVLILSEDLEFIVCHADPLQSLVDFADRCGRELVVVAAVRDQVERLNGDYTECIRMFRDVGALADYEKTQDAHGCLDYYKHFLPTHENPAVTLCVTTFGQLVGGDPLTELLRTVGVADLPATIPFRPPAAVNASMSALTVAAARTVADAVANEMVPGINRSSLMSAVEEVSYLLGWDQNPKFWGWAEAHAEKVRRQYEASNQRFAREMMGSPWPSPSPLLMRNEADHRSVEVQDQLREGLSWIAAMLPEETRRSLR